MQVDKNFPMGQKFLGTCRFCKTKTFPRNASIQFSIAGKKSKLNCLNIFNLLFITFWRNNNKRNVTVKTQFLRLFIHIQMLYRNQHKTVWLCQKKNFALLEASQLFVGFFFWVWNKANLELQAYRKTEVGRDLWRPHGPSSCSKQS